MALKGYLLVDPECGRPCDDAVEMMEDFIDAQEIEVVEPAEAVRRGIDLGDPQGTPALVIASETGRRLATFYFHDEEGGPLAQAAGAGEE